MSQNAVLSYDNGVITAVSEGRAAPAGPRRLIVPAFINAHDHARPTASSFGAAGMPLESWIMRTALGTPPDPYLQAVSAMARSARAGCAAMMIHYTRPSGKMSLVDEAKAIARARADVGIRMAFALAVRDQNPLVYGDGESVLSDLPGDARKVVEEMFVRQPMSPRDYIGLTEEIAAAIAGPMVDVQLALPVSSGAPSHCWRRSRTIHNAPAAAFTCICSETIYQRRWADAAFPGGIVRYLKDIGFLSERVTLAHCAHATPEELEIIAASGARIVTNFSSNLHLHSGLAPIRAAHTCGCDIAVGVDGTALDEDDDVIREMRLVQMMHGGVGFERTWTRGEFLGLAIRNGRRATGAPGTGELAPGAPADFVVLDLDRIDRDAIMDVDPVELLFARGNASHVIDVVVDGRTIIKDGNPVGVDLAAIDRELRGMYRKGLSQFSRFEQAWKPLEIALTTWYGTHMGCS